MCIIPLSIERIELTTTRLSGVHSTTELYALYKDKVGMAGFEPTHIRIKNKCLTAWLHSIGLVTSD
jgi:hypothetical protein